MTYLLLFYIAIVTLGLVFTGLVLYEATARAATTQIGASAKRSVQEEEEG